MEVKITLWAVQDVEKWSKNFFGGPPARTSEFFFAPGGLQERSGVDFYSVLAAPWGQGVPRGPPEASGSSCLVILGAILPPFWHRLRDICRAVLASVVGLREVKKQQFSERCDPPARTRKKQQPHT